MFYLRTVDVSDHIPLHHNETKNSTNNATRLPEKEKEGLEIILEPLQKWQCPVELVRS